jgi:hypothetical protein
MDIKVESPIDLIKRSIAIRGLPRGVSFISSSGGGLPLARINAPMPASLS